MNQQEESLPLPQEEPSSPSLGHSDTGKKRKVQPVLIYITVLFAAALFLLVLSFFMQQRNGRVMDHLVTSVSDMQNVSELKDEIYSLAGEIETQASQIEDLQEKNDDLSTKNDQMDLQLRAMAWLVEIQGLYSSGDLNAVKAMIEDFKAAGLDKHLPTESTIQGSASPADQYQQILVAIF